MPQTTTAIDPRELVLAAGIGGNSAASSSGQLIVADGHCPRIGELLHGALHELVALAGPRNPLQAIGDELESRRLQGHPVSTLHIVAHGRFGGFQIGGEWIDAASLVAHADQLAQWQVPTIALWSCEAGADRNFVALFEELTGSRIAHTSGRIEGSNPGSWTIGHGLGQPKTLDQVFDSGLLASWQGSLAGFVYPGRELDFSVTPGVDIRIAGQANTRGETWLYKDVLIDGSKPIDAIVRFDSVNSGSMTAFDSTSSPYDTPSAARYFQPSFTFGSAGGSASFTVSLIEGGSYSTSNPGGTPTTIRNVFVDAFDLDSPVVSRTGNGGNQYVSFANAGSPQLSSGTALQASVSGSATTVGLRPGSSPGDITALPGTTVGDNYRARLNYAELSSTTFVVGASNGAGVSNYGFGFVAPNSAPAPADSPPTVTAKPSYFSIGNAAVLEGDTARVTISRSGNLDTTQVLRLVSLGGTAQVGLDYDKVDQVITFDPGQKSYVSLVPTKLDTRFEGAESIALQLTSERTGADAPVPQVTRPIGYVSIVDGDEDGFGFFGGFPSAPPIAVSGGIQVAGGSFLNFASPTNSPVVVSPPQASFYPALAYSGAPYFSAGYLGSSYFAPSYLGQSYSDRPYFGQSYLNQSYSVPAYSGSSYFGPSYLGSPYLSRAYAPSSYSFGSPQTIAISGGVQASQGSQISIGADPIAPGVNVGFLSPGPALVSTAYIPGMASIGGLVTAVDPMHYLQMLPGPSLGIGIPFASASTYPLPFSPQFGPSQIGASLVSPVQLLLLQTGGSAVA